MACGTSSDLGPHDHAFLVVSDGDNLGRDDLLWTVEALNPEDAARAVFEAFEAAREVDPHSPHEFDPRDEDPQHPDYPVNGKCSAWLTVFGLDGASRAYDQYVRFESGAVEYFGTTV